MELLFLLSGLAIGVACTYLIWKSTTSGVITKEQYLELDKQKCLLEDRYHHLLESYKQLEKVQREREFTELDLRENLARHESERQLLQEKLAEERARQEELLQRYTSQFENLTHQMMQRNADRLTDMNQEKLHTLLTPLQDKLRSFESRIEATQREQVLGSKMLQEEIKRLAQLNHKISEDARNLTEALKGDSKTQGLWGEVVLERILDHSGLQKGQEFFVQGSGLKLVNEEGALQKPDVIIVLPEKKHVIIDAKVSLKAYEAYISSKDESQQAMLLKRHLESLRGHVNDLSSKYYQKLDKLKTLDFVLMFLPVEGSLSTALQYDDQDLLAYAWERKVVLVTPTTLLATLKTIASLWRNEKQHRNALQIAREGGKIYDKLCAVMTDLQQLGKGMQQSERLYQVFVRKLVSGRGNLLHRARRLKELGVNTHRRLPKEHEVYT